MNETAYPDFDKLQGGADSRKPFSFPGIFRYYWQVQQHHEGEMLVFPEEGQKQRTKINGAVTPLKNRAKKKMKSSGFES